MTSFAGNPALRRHWHAVASVDDLGDGPVRRRLLGVDVVLWRAGADGAADDGVVAGALDRCPHREAPLSAGSVVDGCLVCPYHGWSYASDGACVRIPSSAPGTPVPPRARLAPVHVTVRYGLVWVSLEEPAGDVPSMPWEHDPRFRRLNNPVEEWHVAATRMVDNFLDISHFPYVHLGSFGGAAEEEVPHLELGELPDGWYGYAYDVVAANEAAGATGASGQATATVTRRMSTGFVLPFAVRSTIEYGTGLCHHLLLLSAPVDDERSWFTFVVWRNDLPDDGTDPPPAEEVLRLDRLIGREDRRMLERMRGTLPLDATTLVSVQADRASVEWKRRLRAMLEP